MSSGDAYWSTYARSRCRVGLIGLVGSGVFSGEYGWLLHIDMAKIEFLIMIDCIWYSRFKINCWGDGKKDQGF
jgi:hypothetical protein